MKVFIKRIVICTLFKCIPLLIKIISIDFNQAFVHHFSIYPKVFYIRNNSAIFGEKGWKVDWYPVDDSIRDMLTQLNFQAERQAIKDRQFGLPSRRAALVPHQVSVVLLIDWIGFYAISTIFQLFNGGLPFDIKM